MRPCGFHVGGDIRSPAGGTEWFAHPYRSLRGSGSHQPRCHRPEFRTGSPTPSGPQGTGPFVAFARSGLSTRWSDQHSTLLELAEACDIPTRWSCRTGVCHTCTTPLLTGQVQYTTQPLEDPAPGEALPCCSIPATDLRGSGPAGGLLGRYPITPASPPTCWVSGHSAGRCRTLCAAGKPIRGWAACAGGQIDVTEIRPLREAL
ncbi:2Fe-2S iron-sulfur cluster-binding protein [Streptomyces sp. NPDC048527]|uniref:2Fe-2S iron-sulfur cluster-binding protein n=1 Tax=Streptomyces sp. NPDC048527 TaxID=3365568 RepID=UPI0037221F98